MGIPARLSSATARLLFPPLIVTATVPLAYFAAAALAIRAFGANSPVWVANGIALAAILRQKPQAWPILLFLVGLADAVAFSLFGDGPAPLITLFNLLEILLAALALHLTGGMAPPLFSGSQLTRFVLVCLLVPILSSASNAGVLWSVMGMPFLTGWKTSYVASALGFLIVTPFLLSWTDPHLRQPVTASTFARGMLLVGVLIVVAVVVFGQPRPSLLFLTFPVLLLVTWGGGLLGVTSGAIALTAIGLWFTIRGEGAIMSLVSLGTYVAGPVQVLQLYLVAAVLSSLPLAVVMAQQNSLAERLRAAVEVRSEFLAAMSHEIRTPMTGVLGMTDILAAEDLTAKQRNYVDAIRASGRHLLHVINDILDFSRIETGKLELECIDFSIPALLEQLRSMVQPMAIERGLDLRFNLSEHSPPILKGDPTRLKQVLLNLAGNAIKFTERGSVIISVSAHPAEDDGLRFRFEVRDTGVGIAPEKQAELFSAFAQADRSTARRFGGSGLGLAISKRLVEAMGGQIGLNSMPGLGSVFWFEVPLRLGDRANLEKGARVHFRQASPRRILVAEDVEINRAILGDVLSRQGHHLVFAENGAEALALAQKERFDLILMDVQMPIMDGVEATRRIRRMDGPLRDVPILALTANVMASERERYLAAGVNECLMKPIDWDQLHDAIGRYGGGGHEVGSPEIADEDRADETPLLDRQRLEQFGIGLTNEQLVSWVTKGIEDADRAYDRMAPMVQFPDALAGEAHKLTGTSGTFGFARISEIAAQIEDTARQGGEVEALLTDLKKAVADTSAALRQSGLIADDSHLR